MTFPIPVDFPDWLSPIIVKEVRQGLRGKLFVIAFMALHVMLFSWALITASSTAADKNGADVLFWVILLVGLVVISMSAQGIVRSERRNNTLELLQLTRQSAWRIALGKWSAVMLQVVLFLASLLPYAVLRYFFGTFDLMRDVMVLGYLFFGSVTMVALMLLISCYGRWLGIAVNVLLALFLLGLLQAGASIMMATSMFGGSAWGMLGVSGVPLPVLILLGTVGYLMVYAWLLICMAAGNIASISDNLATRKRLLGWLIFAPALIAAIGGADEKLLVPLMVACAPVLLVLLDALLMPTSPAVPAFAAFGRRGVIGRVAALVFAPSRASGIFYTVGTLGLFLLLPMLAAQEWGDKPVELICACVAVLNMFLLPVALAHAVRNKFPGLSFAARFWIFVVVEALFAVVSALVGSVGKLSEWKIIACASPVGAAFHTGSVGWQVSLGYTLATVVLVALLLARYLAKDAGAAWRMCRGERAEIPAA